jgi:dienelactone hydrolase
VKKVILILAYISLTLLIQGCAGPSALTLKNDLVFNTKEEPFHGWIDRNRLFVNPKEVGKKKSVVILMHPCGGIGPKSFEALTRWTEVLTGSGYGVLVVDHLTGRIEDQRENCLGSTRPVNQSRLVKDATDAASLLSKVPSIDSKRIFALGFSLGAMTAASAAGKVDKGKIPLRAVAGLYGGCRFDTRSGPEVWLDGSETIPVLWLMGSEDKECPPDRCMGALNRLKQRVPSTDWFLYEGVTHGWDSTGMSGMVITSPSGAISRYRYDEAATKDSHRRVIEFFNQFK